MATKKKTGKKKTEKKRKRKPARSVNRKNLKRELIKSAVALTVLLLLVVVAGVLARHYLIRKQPVQVVGKPAVHRPVVVPVKKAKVHKAPVYKKPDHLPPRFEIYPKKEIPSPRPVVPPRPPLPEKLPKVAIIIDDLGYDTTIADKFAQLDAVLTFSILPYSPYQKKIAGKARARGFDVMLHLPMEPEEYPRIDPGPGALLTTMSPDELIRQLKADLDCIPHIRGVNNHMGSRLTADSDRMNQVFSVLKQRGLFFIDSRTTAGTRSDQSARLFKMPFAQRDVFLDHVNDPDHVRRQIRKLIRFAQIHGEAIGIGHPHPVTYDVLRELLPRLKQKVVLVPASRIVHIAG